MNLECVYKVYRGLGRTDVVVRFVFLELCSAVGARVGVESCVDISEAYFGFQVPMLVQNPGIPVCRTHAQEPSLVTPVREFGEVASQKREVVFQPANVVLTSEQVCSNEVSCPSVAKPIACFRLQKPMFPLPVVRECPSVVVGRYVERPSVCQSRFHACVQCSEGVV